MDEYLIPTQFGERGIRGKEVPLHRPRLACGHRGRSSGENSGDEKEALRRHATTAGRTSSETARCASPTTANPAALPGCPCCRCCSGRGLYNVVLRGDPVLRRHSSGRRGTGAGLHEGRRKCAAGRCGQIHEAGMGGGCTCRAPTRFYERVQAGGRRLRRVIRSAGRTSARRWSSSILFPEAAGRAASWRRLTDLSAGTVEAMETGQEYRAFPWKLHKQ